MHSSEEDQTTGNGGEDAATVSTKVIVAGASVTMTVNLEAYR
jgi:hypothetical protein